MLMAFAPILNLALVDQQMLPTGISQHPGPSYLSQLLILSTDRRFMVNLPIPICKSRLHSFGGYHSKMINKKNFTNRIIK